MFGQVDFRTQRHEPAVHGVRGAEQQQRVAGVARLGRAVQNGGGDGQRADDVEQQRMRRLQQRPPHHRPARPHLTPAPRRIVVVDDGKPGVLTQQLRRRRQLLFGEHAQQQFVHCLRHVFENVHGIDDAPKREKTVLLEERQQFLHGRGVRWWRQQNVMAEDAAAAVSVIVVARHRRERFLQLAAQGAQRTRRPTMRNTHHT